MLAHLGQFVVNLISSLSYAGVFLAMAIESCAIPLPSEVILPFTGYMVFLGRFNLWYALIAAVLGNLLGALVAYYIGLIGGRPFLRRYGRYLLINERELAWTERVFERYGEITVFIGRILPVVRTFISLPAGISRMSVVKMAVYTVLGAIPWCLLLIFVGDKLGQNWESLKSIFHGLDAVIGLAVLVCIILFIRWKRSHSVKHV